MKKIIGILALAGILLLSGCGQAAGSSEDTLKVGASPTPHAEILEHVKPMLEEEGINLEIVKFDDYILPNKSLAEEEIDANYFSTVPYFNLQKEENDYDFANVAGIHLEPMGIYSHDIKNVADVPEGATVIVSNVASEWGRVLRIFEDNGLIKVKDGIAIDKATFDDITENPKQLVFKHEVEPTLLATAYENHEGDLVAINSNFAYEKGLNPVKDSLMLEAQDSPYVNIIATRTEDKDDPRVEKLVTALQDKEVQSWIEEKWGGSVIPVAQ
ncbi:MetQ/NlpA family ABC transporter substrate-binding protein [Enterococcus sp. 669A]|uniref:Lipoprotein n=1 Tax=Candidatus Enterococcus moelleringii TaxID=2815325 RepID=A0ABS3LGW2_9ENTE|nr:MetQ/NlpA family ABC transporter substrate-binding protein [Enterococcus sp. 669A]MBO1308863.1 MetQ/NlpA family ABC transporter substrate-binding protein [Enterococcus sp. 669A]